MFHEYLLSRLLTFHGLAVLLGLFIYVGASHARHQRRHPSAAIAWVVLLTLLPYVALPLYLLFGNRKVLHSQAARTPLPVIVEGPCAEPAMKFQRLALAMGLPRAASYRELAVHTDGADAWSALKGIILGARHELDLCTFLLGRDALGQEIAEMLMRKAAEGVRVRLLIDGIGLYLGGRPNLKQLSRAGVQVGVFVSPWRSPKPGRTNLRNHRKMVIADGERLWCGGRNLAAEYFLGTPEAARPKAPWVDLTFDLQGELVTQAQARFDRDWAFATRHLSLKADLPPSTHVKVGSTGAQLIPSGPDQADDTVYTLLVSSCFNAQTRILAVTPYFVPDATLLMALTLAARRGIAVDLVLPRHSNHRLADLARHAALREMAAAGARIWFTEAMVHAKVVVVDEAFAMAGSANLDERSLFLNYELMIAFYEPADVNRFAQWIAPHLAGAVAYRARPPSMRREIGEGLIRWLAFQL